MKLFQFIIFFFISTVVYSQTADTLKLSEQQSLVVKNHTPHKASLLSALAPGLGQIYNKKYWKAPIVWGGLGAGIFFIIDNKKGYDRNKKAFVIRKNGGVDEYSDPNRFKTNERLIADANSYRKNMELSYVITTLLYVLNVVDATVDAHLYTFNVSDDLTFNLDPKVISTPNSLVSGFTLTLKL